MATLASLPTELLQAIYCNLANIDDVHYLARACKNTYTVINDPKIYTKIMRSAISQSSAHRYDIQLCRLLRFHHDTVERGRPIRSTQTVFHTLASVDLNPWETRFRDAILDKNYITNCTVNEYSDGDVHEILARWGGLRVLQNLWLERQLNDQDFLVVNDHTDPRQSHQVILDREEDFQHGLISARSTPEAKFYTSFDADQRGRFHAAITGLWILNEIRWILSNFSDQLNTYTIPLAIADSCKRGLEEQIQTLVLDYFDQYAMHSFLYHHLLPLHSPALADQCSSKLPLTYPSELDKEPTSSVRLFQLFLVTGQACLQPPDIIDLVIRDKIRRKSPYPQTPLPASTERYILPTSANSFPSNWNLHATGERGSQLASTSLAYLTLFQRATINQSRIQPAPQLRSTTMNGLFPDADMMSKWFEKRALVQFDMEQRRDQKDIRIFFERRWRETKWIIWWWAASEDKTRMKMERWMCT